MKKTFVRCFLILAAAAALCAPQLSAIEIDVASPGIPYAGTVSPREAILYSNVPQGAETVFTTAGTPRTGGADEAMFDGPGALITGLQFGYSVVAGGPAAFDARIRFYDDIDLAAGAGVAQFANQVADFRVSFTGQVAGAFITNLIDLSGLPGGGVTVTANAANLGVPNLTDAYFQVDFVNPGTNTQVAANGVTYIFDGSGVNAGRTFADPILGGNGTDTDEVYWRDTNANGVITADEARLFTGLRANMVLHLEGTLVPEPTSLSLIGVGCALLAFVRRRG